MDLEVSSTSSMLHKADNERIVYADELWYKAQDFEEERKVVKAEFSVGSAMRVVERAHPASSRIGTS